MPGDMLLFPSGLPHALSSEIDNPLQPWDELVTERTRTVEIGTPPARTRILCAGLRPDSRSR